MGFRVLRFLGTRLIRSTEECVTEIATALAGLHGSRRHWWAGGR